MISYGFYDSAVMGNPYSWKDTVVDCTEDKGEMLHLHIIFLILHAHQFGGLSNMCLQINNYPACIITKLDFPFCSAHAETAIFPVLIKFLLWVHSNIDVLERFHLRFCKLLFKVKKHS